MHAMENAFHAGVPSELWSSPATLRKTKWVDPILQKQHMEVENMNYFDLKGRKSTSNVREYESSNAITLFRGELKHKILNTDGLFSWNSYTYIIEKLLQRGELLFRPISPEGANLNVRLSDIEEIKFFGGGACRFDLVVKPTNRTHSFLAPTAKLCEQWVNQLNSQRISKINSDVQPMSSNKDLRLIEMQNAQATWGSRGNDSALSKSLRNTTTDAEFTLETASTTVSNLGRVLTAPQQKHQTKKRTGTKQTLHSELGGLGRVTASSLAKATAKRIVTSEYHRAGNRSASQIGISKVTSSNRKPSSSSRVERDVLKSRLAGPIRPVADTNAQKSPVNHRTSLRQSLSISAERVPMKTGLIRTKRAVIGTRNDINTKKSSKEYDRIKYGRKKSDTGRSQNEPGFLNAQSERFENGPISNEKRVARMARQLIVMREQIEALKRELHAVTEQRDAFETLLNNLSDQHSRIKLASLYQASSRR